jgi:ATP-dependent protease ClpP protease subunit
MAEPIQSVLLSGEINEPRMYRALGELADISAARSPSQQPVVVVDSDGGSVEKTYAFLEHLFDDAATRSVVEQSDVKIYNAQSGAAIIALSIGQRRFMSAGTHLGFHLPLVTLRWDQVGDDGRMWRAEPLVRSGAERTLTLMSRYGVDGPEQRSQIMSTGWLRLSSDECKKRGLVEGLFRIADEATVTDGSHRVPDVSAVLPIRTVLISGFLSREVLTRVLIEMRDLAALSDEEVIFLLDSCDGNMFAIDTFLESLQQESSLRRIAERASVKIYNAQEGAALVAFSMGRRHELARDAKVTFTLGNLVVQVGNPDHVDSDWRISSQRMSAWFKHRGMVYELLTERGLSDLTDTLCAAGRIELPAEECLRRGLVGRLF